MLTHNEILLKPTIHSMHIHSLPTIGPVLKPIDQGNETEYVPDFQEFQDLAFKLRFGEGGEPE